jgi:hypothetical protein
MPSGNSPSPSDGFGVADGRLKLPAGVARALSTSAYQPRASFGHRSVTARRLRAMMAGAPTFGRPFPNWHFSDIAPLADVRFAPIAAVADSQLLAQTGHGSGFMRRSRNQKSRWCDRLFRLLVASQAGRGAHRTRRPTRGALMREVRAPGSTIRVRLSAFPRPARR